MTTAEQTRHAALLEAADALDHHALELNGDDYAAAQWCRAADLVRHMAPQHTDLSPDFLATHDITTEELDMLNDLREHKWWSVRHWLAHWFDIRRFR